ncbi:MAG: T9SS type A sorting domain-containing protein [Bacteroidota bacterium]|nr:T9SS type A sorting domain-containing protein [Bacteroidota bacterium]
MRVWKVIIYFVLILGQNILAQTKEICILDLTSKNSETTKGNLFSLEHILKSAGFSYSITDSVDLAIKSKIVLPTSNIEQTTFSQTERDSIRSFISKGGILIATNIKDTTLFDCFGVSATSFNSNRFFIRFSTNYDPGIFKLFDEPYEKEICLGDTADFISTIGTRAFTLTTADTLAQYETGEVAMAYNNYNFGHVYLLGTQYKEVILRPQVKADYRASRVHSNYFEAGQDVYVFFMDGVLKKHLPYVVSKHGAPCNFKAALIISHDVDATTSMEMFDDYASWEKANNINSSYMVTTHYMHDKVAKNFYDGYEEDILRVSQMGHDIQTHSVSHMPDFDNESIVPIGNIGNNRYNYQPYYNGTVSSNVTVFGEAEVSKDLLQNIIHKDVTCFRPGYLAYNDFLINVLDSLGYKFSSSVSANVVMSHFPYFSHANLSMNGRLTDVLEIPNTISDVFGDSPVTEGNYLSKVEEWKNTFFKCYNNSTSSVLLIHPTRYYKLYAQQLLVHAIPQDVVITNLSDYGNYWLNRDAITFTTAVNADTLNIYLNKTLSELNEKVSFVAHNGKDFAKIRVVDSGLNEINFTQSVYETNDVILYNSCERPSYNQYSITEKPQISEVYIYPNPSFDNNAKLHFEIMEESEVSMEVSDLSGKIIFSSAEETTFNLGSYDLDLIGIPVYNGVFIVKIKIGQEKYYLKWVVGE